mmetsp:Transcript_30476/g.50448  ORF Transcript_30476/g.50448 Transcript_30476/m.50448 type:complete len:207 (-) Transcript_30476:213-833(-)
MLAPRKKYWSSPPEVIDAAIDLAQISGEDIVYDIGCGNGQFLARCCVRVPGCRAVGVEIEATKADEARRLAQEQGVSDRMEIITANALEICYDDATVVFAFLIPRGLRKILPMIQDLQKKKDVKVVTFLHPFQGINVVGTWKNQSEDAMAPAWPLYLYHFFQTPVVDNHTKEEATTSEEVTAVASQIQQRSGEETVGQEVEGDTTI